MPGKCFLKVEETIGETLLQKQNLTNMGNDLTAILGTGIFNNCHVNMK